MLHISMMRLYGSVILERVAKLLLQFPCLTFSRSWYFMIRCTGLISRSVICSLWPNLCFKSWWRYKGKMSVVMSLSHFSWLMFKMSGRMQTVTWVLPQNMCRCTLKQCALIWACFGSTQCTCGVFVPVVKTKFQRQKSESLSLIIILNKLLVTIETTLTIETT